MPRSPRSPRLAPSASGCACQRSRTPWRVRRDVRTTTYVDDRIGAGPVGLVERSALGFEEGAHAVVHFWVEPALVQPLQPTVSAPSGWADAPPAPTVSPPCRSSTAGACRTALHDRTSGIPRTRRGRRRAGSPAKNNGFAAPLACPGAQGRSGTVFHGQKRGPHARHPHAHPHGRSSEREDAARSWVQCVRTSWNWS